MKRRKFLGYLGVAAGTTILPYCNGRKGLKKKPNVILIITDDQGYGDLGCHGNPVIQTPALDNLHSESVRLTNFHVGPTCAPTRASVMTGRYCNRTGVWHTVMGRSLLRKDEATMADVFAQNGYRTGMFGKWHLGDNYPFRPQDRGFHVTTAHGGGGVGQLPDYWGNDYFDDTYWKNGVLKKYEGYCTDIWFNETLQFIESCKNQPFFCYLSTNAPHGPFNVEEKYSGPYLEKGVPEYRAKFYGMITNIDENVARLRAKLRTSGIAENTILIFMTDNGTSAGVGLNERGFPKDGFNAGMHGRKGSEYDGGHRVPCFIHWQEGGLTKGRDIHRLTAHIDLFPTLIDLCQLKRPDVQFDGSSLAKSILNQAKTWPDRTLVTDSQRIEHPEKWRKSAVMTDRWRLINGIELHNMEADPGQRHDVAKQHPEVVTKLRQAYEGWWTDVSRRFDEYCEIVLGSDQENPARLTSHDWHDIELPDRKVRDTGPPWNQQQVRDGKQANGFWAVEVARAGNYDISLRRWPEEVNQSINGFIPAGGPIPGGVPYSKGKAIRVTEARLKIADFDETKNVHLADSEVKFRVELKPGKTRLKTWLMDDRNHSRGAYFVYVRRIS